MNKKFLSAILFGALMVTSTGTFVSCKDYDDEIEELQGQISSLATKSDVEAKLNQLQSAIDAAKADAVDAADLAALEAKVTSMQATIQAAVEADIAGYKAEIEALIKEVEAVVGEIADFVSSVSLDYKGETPDYDLDFFTITEKENVFEDGLSGALTFTKDKQTQVAKNGIVVRVNPTNAVLTPEMISLVNSKGENLDEYVDIKVEKYTDLLTVSASRAATNNGLWKITPVLKEYNEAQFKALKYSDAEKNERYAYAVQINNTLDASDARYVTSEYTIALDEWNPFKANGILHYTVDGEPVYKINNRYDSNSKSLPRFEGTVEMYQELRWKGGNSPVTATEAIVEGDDRNVDDVSRSIPDRELSYFDNRSNCPVALAVQGKAMTIAITDYKDATNGGGEDNDEYENGIAGLYVTLDYEANAVESAPSEWNAWNSYKYTGLNTVVKGTSIEITIDSEETINDYIGFRVYAVNLDGTLVDPDGRAFYVLVGEQAADAQTVTATITPTNDPKTRTSVTKALTDAQSEVITSLLKNQKNNPTVAMDYENNPDKYTVDYNVKFNWNDDETKVVSATFELAEGEIADMINDKTYKASIVYKNTNGHELGTVNFELTKTMPTAFPADFAFRPKQETEDGSGKFIAYMIPEGDSYVVPTPFAKFGVKDLDNVFYGLDDYYKFEFATSAADTDKDGVLNKVTVTDTDGVINKKGTYNLRVSENKTDGYFIDNETWHAVSVWYTYPGISTYSYTDENGDEAWKHGATHEVAYDKALEATYACWEDASAFVWATKEGLSLKPVLQWDAIGTQRSADLSAIQSTNSYNNDYFGLDLESLLNTAKWLAKSATDGAGKAITTIQLKVGDQVNPYYVPSIEGSKIIFKQKETQVDAAPTADHTETLEIVLVDAFGHQVAITLDVTVKAPEKK